MKKYSYIIIPTLVILFSACAGRMEMFGKAGEAKIEASNPAWELAEKYWESRIEPAIAYKALEEYQKAAEIEPNNPGLLAELSHCYYYVANYIEQDKEKCDELFLAGVNIGEQAMALNVNFKAKLDETGSSVESVDALGDDIGGLFWAASNLGKWAATKNMIVRLKWKKQLEAYWGHIRDIDENYYYAGCYRFWGALPTKVPFGDLNDAKAQFEKGIELVPNYFGTRVLMAEYYATKAQDREVYETQLKYVAGSDEKIIPEVQAENHWEVINAKKMLEEIDDLF